MYLILDNTKTIMSKISTNRFQKLNSSNQMLTFPYTRVFVSGKSYLEILDIDALTHTKTFNFVNEKCVSLNSNVFLQLQLVTDQTLEG